MTLIKLRAAHRVPLTEDEVREFYAAQVHIGCLDRTHAQRKLDAEFWRWAAVGISTQLLDTHWLHEALERERRNLPPSEEEVKRFVAWIHAELGLAFDRAYERIPNTFPDMNTRN